MTLVDNNGQLRPALQTWVLIVTVVASIGGWGYTLGYVTSQIHTQAEEISLLRESNRQSVQRTSEIAQRTASLESSLRSIDTTLSRMERLMTSRIRDDR